MKNLLFILLGGLLALNVNAQTPPVAVNDTFYCYFETAITKTKGNINYNDTVYGGTKVIDTVMYNGTNQVVQTYHTGGASIFGFKELTYTPQSGFFGLDSLTYVLSDYNFSTGFDTATIYIKVMYKAYENLDLNNISANINNTSLFQNHGVYPYMSGFNVPKQVNIGDAYYSTINGANLWVSGMDFNGMVRAFATTYTDPVTTTSIYGYFEGDAGPISDEYEEYSYKWDRVWKVSKIDIDYHLANYTNGGYQPIEVIENWPAHGDTSLGQAYNLAPFVDVDIDGIYNPLSGDYPKIKGQQTVFFIKNDLRNQGSAGAPIGAEIHGMAYAYDCPSDSAINNTIFLNYKIYNRSTVTYVNVHTGLWADLDIGNFGDDFVGCDVARSAFYGYNGDNDDEDGGGVSGYGTHPPAQGVVFLRGPKKDSDGADNPLTTNVSTAMAQGGTPYAGLGVGYGDGIIDNEHLGMQHFIYYSSTGGASAEGSPSLATDFYNYLQAQKKDGSPFLALDSVTPTNYMFSGDSDPLFWGTEGVAVSPWSETSTSNIPADRRGLGSTGPFTMQPGDMKELELAFVFGRDYQNTGNTAGIVVMQERIDSIRSYYLDDFQSVCGGVLASVNKVEEQENNLQVYPNPFNNQFMVNYKLENATAQLMVFNMYGKLVSNQVITKQNTLIDLSNEASGIYFVQITDGATRITKKMVKQ